MNELDPAASVLTRYQGGKNGAGVYQKIINCIPAHTHYVEPFAGSAAIYRRKSPAVTSFLVEINRQIAHQLSATLSPCATVINGDGLDYIDERIDHELNGWFFYIDPPYLHSTRKDAELYGDWELNDQDHLRLVKYLLPGLTRAGAQWALSGYRSAMYDEAGLAHGWQRLDYQARTRQATVTESLWTNYDPAGILPSDLTYAGANFRDRERMKRKAARWIARLALMPPIERAFLRAALASTDTTSDAGPQ